MLLLLLRLLLWDGRALAAAQQDRDGRNGGGAATDGATAAAAATAQAPAWRRRRARPRRGLCRVPTQHPCARVCGTAAAALHHVMAPSIDLVSAPRQRIRRCPRMTRWSTQAHHRNRIALLHQLAMAAGQIERLKKRKTNETRYYKPDRTICLHTAQQAPAKFRSNVKISLF